MGAVEGITDMVEVIGHCLSVEVVNHQSFATWCRPLHAHDAPFHIQCHHGLLVVFAESLAFVVRSFPREYSIRHAIGHVNGSFTI